MTPKPRAIAVGFLSSSRGKNKDVLTLKIDLKGVSFKDRQKAVDQVLKLAGRYGL